MVLSELELRHFRNLGIQELRFPPEGVAVIGENAQGKTNLLEAIYYLESFRSFRGAGDGELAEFTKDVFHLKGSVAGNGRTTVAVGFDRKRRKKRVSVDGNEAIRFTQALGHLGAVVFSPADVELVNGGPRLRRRFLDIVLSLNHAGYVEALSGYRKALAQRNAALKADAGPMAARAWDGLLVDNGARVTRMRDEWVARWAETFTRYSATISGDDPLAMSYRPDLSWPGGGGRDDGGPDADAPVAGEDAIRERFHARLEENREADLRRGVTGCGPHRDDLEFTIASHPRPLPARTFGSGGQRRTAALALRLTEAATIRRRRGADPILLLDDAFAELDVRRSERVMALLRAEGTGQVILTVPRESDVQLRGPSLARWRIRSGVIEA